MEELKIGEIIKERYSLVRFLGNGSYGEVWLAHDDILDCEVAIKIYISLDPKGVEEFKREYLTTQDISHPNLLTPNYFDVWGLRPFLVMKYCGNGSSSVFAGKMDEVSLWQFIHDVAAGLNYLHNLPEPIIHQDIKPDNVLVDDSNRYLITDFGISKKVRATMRKQSKRETGVGATAYMGPERFESYPTPVKASDIWSLGASIYELATGELPFCGLGGGMQKNGADLPILDSKWSKDLNALMQACLAKERWNRPSAGKIMEIAEAKINGTSIPSSDDSSSEKPNSGGNGENGGGQPETKKMWTYLIGLIVIGIVVISLFVFFHKDQPTNTLSATSVNEEVNLTTEDKIKIDDNAADAPPIEVETNKEEPDTPLQLHKVNTPTPVSPTKSEARVEISKGTYNFGYAQYAGELRNGKPHGKGRLTFSSSHSDNRLGYSAEPGDYIEGYFTNGVLDPGATLYTKNGSQKKLY